jgi:hypothetical protein
MSARALVIALVGAGCITAAGVGGFYATRLNQTTSAQSPFDTTTAVEVPPPAPAPVEATKPVESPATVSAPPPAPARVERRSPAPARPNPKPVRPEPSTPPAAAPVSASDSGRVEAPPVITPAPPASVPVLPATTVPVSELPPPPPPAPPRPQYIDLRIDEDSVIGVRLDTALSSESAQVEDRVVAIVSRDVVVDGRTAIPAQSRLEGNVSMVERGGKFKERSRLEIRFTSLVLADNTRIPISTEPIFREGDSPKGEAASKIGASAVIGAILGAAIGGKKGAAIGGTAGAAGGTAAVAAGGTNPATLTAGTAMTVKVTKPFSVRVERYQDER